MTTQPVLTRRDIEAFIALLSRERVLWGDALRDDYDHDEMTEYGHYRPEAVLLPETAEAVAAALAYCNRRGIPVTPRGAGTGLCGGCVPLRGGVVLSTERLKRILEIDENNMTVTVEPGLLLMELAKALEGRGLFYPPDPGEKSATLGGNVMTNAGGMRAVRFGVTRDYVLGMQLALADGRLLTLGGKVVKNASGYSLMQLLIGSEGTLGVLTHITLRLVAEPRCNLSVLAPFADLARCVEAVPQVLLCGCAPTAVEFMTRDVIKSAEQYLGKAFPDPGADACLLIRLDAADEPALAAALQTLTDRLLGLGAQDVLLADTDERKSAVWDARGAFLEAIKNSTPSMDECDVVVPRDCIAPFVETSAAIGREQGVRICSFGHAGDGNLHLYVCQDALPSAEWERRRMNTMAALYQKARALGGQVSGEHGIGHAKTGFLRETLGDDVLGLMQGIKQVFDPNGILNPGKVVGGGIC